ncbi:MAG: thiamine pyrophosphate-dependent enzyme [Candidatus Alcyoniella australis]|nr:thiamine pyrophosphate-dependent enzyme [Candidatus Alcyoniella australis]
MSERLLTQYPEELRPEAFPTTFCPGCGHVPLMTAIFEAYRLKGLKLRDTTFVSGIGCASWIPSPHFKADTLHTTHGRPIAFATGVKLAAPQRRVMVISGDGDLASIGGNHLIHAARRDVPIVAICANNFIYGMTGGQVAATTPLGHITLTTPWGNEEPPFDLCKLVLAAGARFVARWYVGHRRELIETIAAALDHEGFAFIEAISLCPTAHERRNKPRGMGVTKDLFVTIEQAQGMTEQELEPKIVCGRFAADSTRRNK